MTSHCLNQCWPDPLMHISGTRGRWVKLIQIEQVFNTLHLHLLPWSIWFYDYTVMSYECHGVSNQWQPTGCLFNSSFRLRTKSTLNTGTVDRNLPVPGGIPLQKVSKGESTQCHHGSKYQQQFSLSAGGVHFLFNVFDGPGSVGPVFYTY